MKVVWRAGTYMRGSIGHDLRVIKRICASYR